MLNYIMIYNVKGFILITLVHKFSKSPIKLSPVKYCYYRNALMTKINAIIHDFILIGHSEGESHYTI